MTSVQVSKSVDEIINEITFVWNKAAEYIIEVSKILYSYQSDIDNKELWDSIRTELINRKIMSKTQIYSLTKIGSNELLHQNIEKLPSAYNTLYKLALLTDEQLTHGFDNNLISPEIRLSDIKELESGISGTDDDDTEEVVIESSNDKLKRSITIYIDEDEIIQNHEYIEKIVNDLKSKLKKSDVQLSGLLKRKIEGD